MRAPELSDGARMVLQVSRIHTVCRILLLLSGTRKSKWSYARLGVFGVGGAVADQLYSDFLKERLFGLSNPQGNHGESIKEAHFHLDNVPTVS
jgi:hypothetical protein